MVLFSTMLLFMVVKSSLAKMLAKSSKIVSVRSENPEVFSTLHQDAVYVYANQLIQKQVGHLDHHGR